MAFWLKFGSNEEALCLSSAITALVHGAGVGAHGLEVVIFPVS